MDELDFVVESDFLEPNAFPEGSDGRSVTEHADKTRDRLRYSQAISLKRIADALETLVQLHDAQALESTIIPFTIREGVSAQAEAPRGTEAEEAQAR